MVYGDIGTSPLYAVKECFHGKHAIALSEGNILGVISLIIWSLLTVVCFKYVAFILRADNKGEGGIFALLAMVAPSGSISCKAKRFIILAAVFGAALLYGDGIITPAISVLSAVEGLEIITGATKPFIIPITLSILFGLFICQSRGTEKIGKVFGPVMILWFLSIAFIGIGKIIDCPKILSSFNPFYAYRFFIDNRLHGFVVLGSVVLCITGGEALYADLGHFGRRAIRFSWMAVAFPSLVCNYLGQGALLLTSPELVSNPFYGMVAKSILLPMVILSTVATVIASQAMITGVFSLTQQAIQLGFLPRSRIVHTSDETKGQIYVPGINYAMMIACLGLVIAFKSSSGLAGAYGIAVTATMGITSVIYFFVLTKIWKWSLWKAVPLLVIFLSFDLAFFGANLLKFFDGGWFTIAIAIFILIIMMTWNKGREVLAKKRMEEMFPVRLFVKDLKEKKPYRTPGTAVFLSISPKGVPVSLLHFFKHAHVLHETVVILSIQFTETPYLTTRERLIIEELGQGLFRVTAYYGYMEQPEVPKILVSASEKVWQIGSSKITYFLGRETLIASDSKKSKMQKWRKILFAMMSRNASSAAFYFRIPPGSVMEIGEQIII